MKVYFEVCLRSFNSWWSPENSLFSSILYQMVSLAAWALLVAVRVTGSPACLRFCPCWCSCASSFPPSVSIIRDNHPVSHARAHCSQASGLALTGLCWDGFVFLPLTTSPYLGPVLLNEERFLTCRQNLAKLYFILNWVKLVRFYSVFHTWSLKCMYWSTFWNWKSKSA